MLQALYNYFRSLFQLSFFNGDTLNDAYIDNFFGFEYFPLDEYLVLICSLIAFVIIIVLSFLFIYRLIRLVGRLFSGGSL